MRTPEVDLQFNVSESRHPRIVELVAVSDEGQTYGQISYLYRQEHEEFEIQGIYVKRGSRGHDIASSLVSAFVEKVGHNQPVRSILSDEATQASLSDNFGEWLVRARELGQPFHISGNELMLFPMVGLLAKGGVGTVHIEVDPIDLKKFPGEEGSDFLFQASAVGSTVEPLLTLRKKNISISLWL